MSVTVESNATYLETSLRAEAALDAAESVLARRFDLDAYGLELERVMSAGGSIGNTINMLQFERRRAFAGFPDTFQPHFYKEAVDDEYGGIRPTLLERLDLPGGLQVLDKREDLHEGVGAFKVRGGLSAVLDALEANPSARIFATASTGNHARGVLLAVNMLNKCLVDSGLVHVNRYGEVDPRDAEKLFRAHIYCPKNIDTEKREALENGGAVLFDAFKTFDAAEGVAALTEAEDRSGRTAYIHPFNSENVIAAQGTLSLESLMQLAARGVNLRETPIRMRIAVGGGGLYAGQQTVFRWAIDRGLLHPDSRIVAVEATNNDSANRELTGQPPLTEHTLDTLAGGIATISSGDKNLPVVNVYSPGGVRVVDRSEMMLAMAALAEAHGGILPEFSGSISLASLLQDTRAGLYQPDALDITITCGGNGSVRTAHQAAQKLLNSEDIDVAQSAAYVQSCVMRTLSRILLTPSLQPVVIAEYPFRSDTRGSSHLRAISSPARG